MLFIDYAVDSYHMCGYLMVLSPSNNDAMAICIIRESTSKYRGTYSMLVILRVCAGVRRVTLHDATLTISNDQSPYFHSSPLPLPVAVPGACRLARIPAMGAQA
ncbi:hypothetical protein T12_11264, partial [Trichinella patagoniensis]